jgi:isocitrate dehydrogenase kinase/phosphatase
MVDDRHVEPDFYIDKAEHAVFIADPDGHDKSTLLIDREELFDFNLEAAPILQVLIGKTLEQARIEVIEEYECALLLKHRKEYKRLRGAELMLTQKQEAKTKRTVEETERRNEQIRAQ